MLEAITVIVFIVAMMLIIYTIYDIIICIKQIKDLKKQGYGTSIELEKPKKISTNSLTLTIGRVIFFGNFHVYDSAYPSVMFLV